MTATEKFSQVLQPEQLDRFLFRSPPVPSELSHIFGGQVLAQALSAGTRTVEVAHHTHSMHVYFLRAGNIDAPVFYHVDPVRDGGSFSTRRVLAKQDGKDILMAAISYKSSEQGVAHQPSMPKVPAPDSLPTDLQRRQVRSEELEFVVPDAFKAFDYKTVGPLPEEEQDAPFENQGFWFKTKDKAPESLLAHQCLLAYATDIRLMDSAMRPHGLRYTDKNLLVASMDHALWFHRPFRVDRWLYYDLAGPVASDGLGLNFGRLYDEQGILIASAAQEGLMRMQPR